MKGFQKAAAPAGWRVVLAVGVVAAHSWQAAHSAPARRPAARAAHAKVYRNVRARIVMLNLPRRAGEGASAVVEHEAIPGFMQAMSMTMPFQNQADARRLKRGDKIRFDMVLRRGNFVIANVRPLPPRTQLKLATAMNAGMNPFNPGMAMLGSSTGSQAGGKS